MGIARWSAFHKLFDGEVAYPSVQRLYGRMQEDPAVRFAHAIEEQGPAASAGGFAGEITIDEALRLLDGV